MSSSTTRAIHDLTPLGLFPEKVGADQDPKCRVIAKVIRELLLQNPTLQALTQAQLQQHAQTRYNYLLQPRVGSVVEIDDAAFQLFQKGVSPGTVKEYFSFRLSEEQARKWIIVPLPGP